MLVKSMKAIWVVGLIVLILGSASLLLVAADEQGAGTAVKLEPGA